MDIVEKLKDWLGNMALWFRARLVAYTIIDMEIFNIMDFIFLSPVLDLGPVQKSNFRRAELN